MGPVSYHYHVRHRYDVRIVTKAKTVGTLIHYQAGPFAKVPPITERNNKRRTGYTTLMVSYPAPKHTVIVSRCPRVEPSWVPDRLREV